MGIFDGKKLQPGELQVVQSENAQPTQLSLIQQAVEKDFDLDKLDRLIALQERYEANEAKKAYTRAIAGFKSESIEIIKTKSGYEDRYRFAELGDIIKTVIPLLSKWGLSHSWQTIQQNNAITVMCILTHEMGHSESTSLQATPDTSGSKNAIQAIGSTVTYLQRYTFKSITGLAEESDDDGHYAGKGGSGPVYVKKEARAKVLSDTLMYLDKNDSDGVRETWDGFNQEERVVLWNMFTKPQRDLIATFFKEEKENG